MNIYDRVKNYAQMKTESDIYNFEASVWELAEQKDPEVLDFLMDLFYDDCEFPEVMYNLVHAVESYPDEMYIKKLIIRMSKDLDRIPFWYYGLVSAVLNEPNCYKIFKRNIHLASKDSLLKLCDLLERECSHLYNHLSEIRNMI